MDHVVAVVTSATFDTVDHRPGDVLRSTCQLAYARGAQRYLLPGQGRLHLAAIPNAHDPSRAYSVHGARCFHAGVLRMRRQIYINVFNQSGHKLSAKIPEMGGCSKAGCDLRRIVIKQNFLCLGRINPKPQTLNPKPLNP